MKPIALYPGADQLLKTAQLGAVYVFAGFQILVWGAPSASIVAYATMVFGAWLIVMAVLRHRNPRPSFEADAKGFSVMGGKPRGWDEFRGVSVHTVRLGFVPILRWVVIKSGHSAFGRRLHIKWTHLSGDARSMAAQIEGYARAAKFADEVEDLRRGAMMFRKAPGRVEGATPASQPAAIVDRPVAAIPAATMRSSPKPAPTPASDAAIRSVAPLRERLFGRRDVI